MTIRDLVALTIRMGADLSGATVESLFGNCCSEHRFEHDRQMGLLLEQQRLAQVRDQRTMRGDSQRSSSSDPNSAGGSVANQNAALVAPGAVTVAAGSGLNAHEEDPGATSASHAAPLTPSPRTEPWPGGEDPSSPPRKRSRLEGGAAADAGEQDSQLTDASITSKLSLTHSTTRQEAYQTMLRNSAASEVWESIPLLSTDGGHGGEEVEL